VIPRRLVGLVCVIAALTAAPRARVVQDWRATSLTSFDQVWQTINDTFPDPAFGGVDWAGARTELRPKVQNAANPEAARAVVRELLARLHRSHFYLLSSSSPADDGPAGDALVPIDLRVSNAGVIVASVRRGSTADRAGVKPGSVVMSFDTHVMSEWIAAAQGSDERERAYDVWRRVTRALHGPEGSQVTLRLKPVSGEEREIRVARVPEVGEIVRVGNLPPLHVTVESREQKTPGGRRVGVIGFNYWMTSINGPVGAAVDRFRRADGLVFDLRGNPGGLAMLMTGIAGHVLDTDAQLGRMRTRETWNSPLKFPANPRTVTDDGRRVTPFAGPVAILIDELTASTSECFAGGLQSLGRARIFGRTSAGAALPASTKQLANGDVLMYAIGDFVTSTGVALEGRGVVPDEAQPLDPAALAAGRDTALDAALRWMDRERR
jgi:carboxyl-terminal processing protease